MSISVRPSAPKFTDVTKISRMSESLASRRGMEVTMSRESREQELQKKRKDEKDDKDEKEWKKDEKEDEKNEKDEKEWKKDEKEWKKDEKEWKNVEEVTTRRRAYDEKDERTEEFTVQPRRGAADHERCTGLCELV